MHLAEINLGKLAFPPDDPRLADFFGGVEMLNRLAAQSDGFVWKYEQTDPGGVVDEVIYGDPSIVVNMTVWRDEASLRAYVFNTLHKRFFVNWERWFAPLGRRNFAMWWIPEGHRPSLREGLDRLDWLEAHGDSDRAFGWSAERGALTAAVAS